MGSAAQDGEYDDWLDFLKQVAFGLFEDGSVMLLDLDVISFVREED
jgi:hypothetical protein